MSLTVYFPRDIANVLGTAACANAGACSVALDGLNDHEREAAVRFYRQGFQAALVAVGLGVGLQPVVDVRQVDKGLSLLWAEAPTDGG
jgi:hypothetical protein